MNPTSLRKGPCARIPTADGQFQLCHYANDGDDKEHLALVLGDVEGMQDVLVRVHSECLTGDVFGSLRCDCGPQLQRAMQLIAEAGRGILVYLRQEGRGIGLAQKLEAYRLQDQGYDTVEANLMLGHEADEREYWAAATILQDLGVRSISLLTNNPSKIEQLHDLGVTVNQRVPLETPITADNADYLATKVQRMRHLLTLPLASSANGNETYSTQTPIDATIQQRIDHLRTQAGATFERQGRPFVTLCYAQSLDGSIAAACGKPLIISSPQSMAVTHALRAAHDAILVGIGTVLNDDPRLNVRLVEGSSPQPIVLDSRLRTPSDARLMAFPGGAWLATSEDACQRKAELHAAGARILALPSEPEGRIDLSNLLEQLGRDGVSSVMVEGGAQVLSSFLAQGLADYAVVTVAPIFIGGLQAFSRPGDAGPMQYPIPELKNLTSTSVGPDTILWGVPTLRDANTGAEVA